MKRVSRRDMLGSAAASVVAGIGLVKGGGTAFGGTTSAPPSPTQASTGRQPPLRTMTLEEFRALDQQEVDRVLSMMDCPTFACCHERVREETGIWIPELVPVFDKLDALRSGGVA